MQVIGRDSAQQKNSPLQPSQQLTADFTTKMALNVQSLPTHRFLEDTVYLLYLIIVLYGVTVFFIVP